MIVIGFAAITGSEASAVSLPSMTLLMTAMVAFRIDGLAIAGMRSKIELFPFRRPVLADQPSQARTRYAIHVVRLNQKNNFFKKLKKLA